MSLTALWLFAVLLSLFFFSLIYRDRAPVGWRWTSGLLALGALFFSPGRWLAHLAILWMYTQAPASLPRRLMPNRNHLPVKHYLAVADALFERGLLLWVGLLLLLMATYLGHQYQSQIRRVFQHPLVRGALALGVTAALAFVGFNLWLEVQFRQPHPVFYTDCHKVWGHRGHPEPPKIVENTIPSFQRAFDLGAPGVEMDVRYNPQRHEFYIGRYDRGPDTSPDQRLTLPEIFAAVGSRGYFWLDTKSIHYMTPEEARQAAQDMVQLLDRFGLRQRAIIESDTPENLAHFAQAGLHTSYWIFNIDEQAFPHTPWGLWRALVRIKRNYIRWGFSAISLDARFYTPMVQWMLKGARIHLFTVDDPEELRHWVRHNEVRVILTDTDRYDITTCP